jgi:hypothetical protein
MQERDFFDWQFRDAPNRLGAGEYDFLVLRDPSGRITGGLGIVGFEMRLGARIERAGWTHNWQSEDSGHGGFLLHSRFTELVDYRCMLRINERVQTIFKLLEIPILPVMPRWWASVDGDLAAELFGFEDPADKAVLLNSAALLRANGVRPLAEHVRRLEPDDEFLLKHWPGAENYARRSGRYLNWRYVDIPNHNYKIIRTERGFAVYRIETLMGSDARIIRIIEWTFGAEETAGALGTLLADEAFDKPVLIDFHCTHRAIGQTLAPFGFMAADATQSKMPDLFRPLYHSGGHAVAIDIPPHRTPKHLDFDAWYITIGDSDVDRVKL